MNTLKEVLAFFDDPERKKFHYFEVSDEISKLPDVYKSTSEAKAECLAMAFQNNTGKKHWGSYLGPKFPMRNDNGDEIFLPDRNDIAKEHIAYWELRAKETKNALMRMRYLGLVYDFKQHVTGEKPDFQSVSIKYIEAIIDVVRGEYMVHEIDGYYLMDAALQLALRFNNAELFENIQDVLWEYDHIYGKDESPGLWGRHFNLMIEHIGKYKKYESSIIAENEARFERIEAMALDGGAKSVNYAHILGEEADLLCKYYHIKNNQAKIKNYLDRELVVIRKSIPLRGGIWGHSMLQKMQNKYRKYHLYEEAKRLYVEIQDLGKKALDDMQGHEFSVPIDNAQLDAYLNDFLSGNPQDVFKRYLYQNIPNIGIERQRQKEEAEKFPLLDLVRTTVYDANGVPINNVGVGKDAEHQKLMYGMYRRMHITAIFLRLEVIKMIEQGKLSLDIILDAFKDSPLIIESQKGLFERGMKAYFDGDYIVACHLLIPQFESAIRSMVAICGGEILQSDKEPQDGNRYISLDGLLESKEVKDGLKEDVQTYFKNLFTDHNGWNLRNLTSHGLLQTNAFNSTMADRLVHAFSLLSLLKFS